VNSGLIEVEIDVDSGAIGRGVVRGVPELGAGAGVGVDGGTGAGAGVGEFGSEFESEPFARLSGVD
jgi:hypothetical protein